MYLAMYLTDYSYILCSLAIESYFVGILSCIKAVNYQNTACIFDSIYKEIFQTESVYTENDTLKAY